MNLRGLNSGENHTFEKIILLSMLNKGAKNKLNPKTQGESCLDSPWVLKFSVYWCLLTDQ